MRRRILLCVLIVITTAMSWAQNRLHQAFTDIGVTGLLPVSWSSQGKTLTHLGYSAQAALEYDSAYSFPIRLEIGYIDVSHSRIAPTGQLYRAWEGGRIALLSGYIFEPKTLGRVGLLEASILAGGALTAANFKGTSLLFAYPSAILEPRLSLSLAGLRRRGFVTGPAIALPLELMWRDGTQTLALGISLAWNYRIGVSL